MPERPQSFTSETPLWAGKLLCGSDLFPQIDSEYCFAMNPPISANGQRGDQVKQPACSGAWSVNGDVLMSRGLR